LTVLPVGFSATGNATSFHGGDTATLLNDGRVLIAGGSTPTNTVTAVAELYSLGTGTFTATASMNVARSSHTATLLNNGMVLIVGGLDQNNNIVTSAELYNPATGTFTLTGSMSSPRAEQTATLLANGKVLIAGGFTLTQSSGRNTLASAEIYDPATGSFSSTGIMNEARYTHTATLLNNGKILIAGGQNEQISGLPSGELYNPATGLFTFTGNLVIGRDQHTATLLNNGNVLLTGGYVETGRPGSNTAELYNPMTGTFTAASNMNYARVNHTATPLNNGTVLIAGGFTPAGGSNPPVGEIYDPVAATFTVTGNMVTPRDSHTATLLTSGPVLFVGGFHIASAEVYQPATLAPSGLVSIAVSPVNPSLGPGAVQRFTATGTFSDNSTQTLAAAIWLSSNNTVAVITNDASNHGDSLAQAAGTSTISACTGSVCGSTTMTVSSGMNVTGLLPNIGTNGTVVMITGGGFGTSQGASTVTFNGIAATPTSWTPTTIVTQVPSGATTGNVVVTVQGAASSGVPFTVIPAPSISGISPFTGSNGTVVTVNGNNFGNSQGTSTITFNGVPAGPTAWNNTAITVPVPQGASSGFVVVTVAGIVPSSGSNFIVPRPSVSSISPTSGPVGTWMTITGSGFGLVQGTSAVQFNGLNAPAANWSDSSIVIQVPPGATTGGVQVAVVGPGTSNALTFTVNVGLAGLSPSFGSAGTSVTIAGSGFGTFQGTSTVSFNGTPATPTSWGIQTITVPVPTGATTGPVVVTIGGTPSNGLNFTVGPGITSLTPNAGASGTSVAIAGSGFGSTQGSSVVTFNGVPASVSAWSDTSITASVPGGATTGLVVATVGGASSNGVAFSVAPSILSLLPSSGPAGTPVTITGSGFGVPQGASTVSFGGATATPTVWSPAKIVVPVPSGAVTGPVVVTVSGQASNGPAFTVGSGSIAGTITRASDSSAVSGALVEALQANLTQASASTAADGTYNIPNLLPGAYDVRVSASGLATALVTGNSVVATGPTTVNAALSSPGIIFGQVTQADGVTPINGASVVVTSGGDTAGSATTDGTGGYAISNLNAGSYGVQASAAGYKSQTQTGVSVTAGNSTPANFSLSGQSTITYDYDELGRLIGVVDSLNGAATYSYDPVGNILGIARTTSGQVSIIGFTPKTGPVGTSVTISGTGFSGTPSLNTVSFNGTGATVTSATTTQIVASVPSGASTGLISVTSPNGSATSASPFTVAASPGTPTITGFLPPIGAAGSTVTVSGTNFGTAGNTKVRINSDYAVISSLTSTTINAIVPSASSGRVTVETPGGTAVGGDFFILPLPPLWFFTPADVGFTGRLTKGTPLGVTVNTGGQIALIVFDGVAGQSVTVQVTGNTMLPGSGLTSLSIWNPDGSLLAGYLTLNSSSGSFPAITLPRTGSYQIFVNPWGNTGSMTLNLN
jgi:YD repeat-containing protein